jgi:tmRNA-binding protein
MNTQIALKGWERKDITKAKVFVSTEYLDCTTEYVVIVYASIRDGVYPEKDTVYAEGNPS